MYDDYPPPGHPLAPEQVTVIEESDFPCNVADTMAMIATGPDFEGEDQANELLYWVVFANTPRVCECFTADAMKRTLEKLNKEAKKSGDT